MQKLLLTICVSAFLAFLAWRQPTGETAASIGGALFCLPIAWVLARGYRNAPARSEYAEEATLTDGPPVVREPEPSEILDFPTMDNRGAVTLRGLRVNGYRGGV